MTELLRRLRDRIERSCERLGLSYPWWIPAYSTLAAVTITVIAYGQRGVLTTSVPVLVAGVITLVPVLLWVPGGWLMPPWVEAVITTAAVALYLTQPVSPDFAPLLFLLLAGEVAATSRLVVGLAVATLDIAVLVVAAEMGHLHSASLYVVGVVLGMDVGIAMRWQMRALAAERANTTIAQQQAMLAERQRLAREVHDVVGHSLSITLLHVTGARHSLQQHADIPDAIDSLTEAEKVGRTAMGELRRTVAVLGTGSSEAQPLPGLDDLPDLVARSRAAGLDVSCQCSDDVDGIGGAAGLGLYRIVQESLANIAKHAPTAKAWIRLESGADGVHLSVRNTLPGGAGAAPGTGRGLPGMAARAEQMGAALHAGVDGDCWLIDVALPAGVPDRTAAAPS